MHKFTALVTLVLATFVASSPVPRPDGTLGGVVDAVAPITAGLGVTLNNLLGFKDTPAAGGGSTPAAGGSSTPAAGGSPAPAAGGSPAPAAGGSPAPAAGGSPAPAAGGAGDAGGGSAVLGGVVDALAPITGGVGVTVNNLAGFH
ncbi:hypothetical protein LPJ53_003313 [Coemansia erecta]|uniref:Uncharacterized protein n=1 Tax=Coemansia erecta TaxID=147472 RepID=A0A9W7Y050_9FUNG|nr:hypothetical protein LPJ53_003313 [Coemansia erecta]